MQWESLNLLLREGDFENLQGHRESPVLTLYFAEFRIYTNIDPSHQPILAYHRRPFSALEADPSLTRQLPGEMEADTG